jgi:hypothetical protein
LTDGFDWDGGNLGKCQKHGVSIAEIEELFRRSGLRVFPDVAHSAAEARLLGIGRTSAGRAVFLAFTVRERQGRRLIRPISARYRHQKEIAAYEQAEAADTGADQ